MIELIKDGGVTSAKGFSAGATYAGLKTEYDTLDLGILLSDRTAKAAATFTTNNVESPSVTASRARSDRGVARGVVANSGCANCSVGPQGLMDAEEMTELVASHVGVGSEDLFVARHAPIGNPEPIPFAIAIISGSTLDQ